VERTECFVILARRSQRNSQLRDDLDNVVLRPNILNEFAWDLVGWCILHDWCILHWLYRLHILSLHLFRLLV